MKKKIKASMTVEAALVMPIVIFTIFTLLYLTFYLHDKYTIQGTINSVIHKASFIMQKEADIFKNEIFYEEYNHQGIFDLFMDRSQKADEIKKYLLHEIAEGLFITDVTNIRINVDLYNIEVAVQTESRIALHKAREILIPLSDPIYKVKYGFHSPAETLRMSEVILETGSKIRGVDKLKKQLENMIGFVS